MDEVLTLKEIEERIAPDWVLIAEPEIDDRLEVIRGKVVFHSPIRGEVGDKARELKLDGVAVRYLGEYPEHMVLGLRAPTFLREARADPHQGRGDRPDEDFQAESCTRHRRNHEPD